MVALCNIKPINETGLLWQPKACTGHANTTTTSPAAATTIKYCHCYSYNIFTSTQYVQDSKERPQPCHRCRRLCIPRCRRTASESRWPTPRDWTHCDPVHTHTTSLPVQSSTASPTNKQTHIAAHAFISTAVFHCQCQRQSERIFNVTRTAELSQSPRGHSRVTELCWEETDEEGMF